MILVLAIYVGVMKMMNKEIAQYINDLLADRERLLDERKDDGKDYELNFVLKQETEWELGIIYQAQKSMDYIIEEDN
mgnify:FL=1